MYRTWRHSAREELPMNEEITVIKVEMQSQTEEGQRAMNVLVRKYGSGGMTERLAATLVNESVINTANL
jgi:hypothetical protein